MKKVLMIFAMLPLLCCCGFGPMYRSGEALDIFVLPISGTNGIDLRNSLDGKFGVAGNESARYRLAVNLSEPMTTYKALQKTGDATWQEVKLHATYVLTDNGKEIARGSDTAAESYTFVRYLVAANASYNAAVQSSIKTLGEKISARVLAVAGSNRPPESK